jgi:Zn-dependent protease
VPRNPFIGPPLQQPGPLKRALGPLAVIGALLLKFIGPVLKFLPILWKTGGSMVVMIWVYSMLWGWKWAAGFVVLLLVHECGHLLAAKRYGLRVSAPMFIPFMGAFIALKEAPRNAWIEAQVGIGGPLLGTLGAVFCHALGVGMGEPLLIALAWSAYFLNLFNLVPLGQLDGGRIVTAISPWMWLIGFVAVGYFTWQNPGNIILWLILIMSLPRVLSLFRPRPGHMERYYEVTPSRRLQMAAMYFGLIVFLVLAMRESLDRLRHVHGISHETHPSQFIPDDVDEQKF